MELQVKWDNTIWSATNFVEVSSSPKYVGWRCLHMLEGGYPNPDHMPVVRPSLNIASVLFNSPMQWASFWINKSNMAYTGPKWRSTYNGGIAFTNNQGFDDPDAGPRADYVNRRDLTSPLPKLMKGIICGGSFYTGTVSTSLILGIQELLSALRLAISYPKELARIKRRKSPLQALQAVLQSSTGSKTLTLVPGKDAADATLPMDPALLATLIREKVWYFTATTRSGDRINNFPQGEGGPVLIGYFLNKPAIYPLSWFEPWSSDDLPDPLKLYHPL
jgi:hypothetical protein